MIKEGFHEEENSIALKCDLRDKAKREVIIYY